MGVMNEPTGAALRLAAITQLRYGVIPGGSGELRQETLLKRRRRKKVNQIIMFNLFNEPLWEEIPLDIKCKHMAEARELGMIYGSGW